MDLSKKVLIAMISTMVITILTTIIPICILFNKGPMPSKTSAVFVLIFALVLLGLTVFYVVVSHRDMMLETSTIIVSAAMALVGILFLAGSAKMIDMYNNPLSSLSGVWTPEIIELVSSLFAVPTAAGAGYLLSL